MRLSYDQLVTYRETYDILEYFGDLGGLWEAFTVGGGLLMAPILAIALPQTLAAEIFMVKPRTADPSESEDEPLGKSVKMQRDDSLNNLMNAGRIKTIATIKRNLQTMRPLKPGRILLSLLCGRRDKKSILQKTDRALRKELDLRTFLKNQRILMTAIQGLLTGRQQTFVDQVCNHVVHESTEYVNSCSEDGLKGEERFASLNHVWRMLNSTSLVDQRLIDAYKIREINRKGKRVFNHLATANWGR